MTSNRDVCPVLNETFTQIPDKDLLVGLYKIWCPVLMFISFTAFAINSFLLFVGHRYTRNKSPVFLMSLNLAATDSLASLFAGITFLINSYLPIVHGYRPNRCGLLAFEIIRHSSLIASALHLLALALIHYRGTVNPLHYRDLHIFSLDVAHSILAITIASWLLPFTALTIFFSSFHCQGFLDTANSCPIHFFGHRPYRFSMMAIFACPLAVMLMLYTKIFFIIRESHFYRARGQLYNYSSENSTVNSSVRTNIIPLQTGSARGIAGGVSRVASDHRSMVVELTSSSNNNGKLNCSSGKLPVKTVRSLTRTGTGDDAPEAASIAPSESYSVSLDGCATTADVTTFAEVSKKNGPYYSLNKHRKALLTTLSIVGTYIFFYMPSVIFLTLTCEDACPFPLKSIPVRKKFFFALTVNLLFVSKGVLDPFIYLFRYKEVKDALERLFNLSFYKR